MRYILFAGWDYYPSGGAHDMLGVFRTLEEAILSVERLKDPHDSWAHVYDIEEGKIVWEWRRPE